MPHDQQVESFIEAYLKLVAVQDSHEPEPYFAAEGEEYDARGRELKQKRAKTLVALNAATSAEEGEDEAFAAFEDARNALKNFELQREETLRQREEGLQRAQKLQEEEEDAQLRVCVQRLLLLNSAFKKIIQPPWMITPDEEEQPEPMVGDETASITDNIDPVEDQQQLDRHSEKSSQLSSPLLQDSDQGREADGDHTDDNPFEDDPFEDALAAVKALQRASSQTLGRSDRESPHVGAATATYDTLFRPRPYEMTETRQEQRQGSAQKVQKPRKLGKRKRPGREQQTREEGSDAHDAPYHPHKPKPLRRRQDNTEKEEKVRKELRSRVLVATRSISMTELSASHNRHFINYDEQRGFYILRCDVCGLHFRKGSLVGARTHLSTAPEHFSLREAETFGEDSTVTEAVFRLMAINVLGCSEETMKTHNAALEKDIELHRYVIRNAVSGDRPTKDLSFHPEHPAVLLPRDQEKNRPRWRPEQDLQSPNVAQGAGLPVQSDLFSPKVTSKLPGITPGQVYWIRTRMYDPFRLAMALPYRNLSQIGLPDRDVTQYTERMGVKFAYDEKDGYFHDEANAWGATKAEPVYPMLYLDKVKNGGEPEVVYPQTNLVKFFSRDEIKEGDPAFERLFLYLDHAKLWFMNDEAKGAEDIGVPSRSPTPGVLPEASRQLPTIVVSDGDDDDSDSDSDVPSLAAIVEATPPKPSSRISKRGSKEQGRGVRNRPANTSRVTDDAPSSPTLGVRRSVAGGFQDEQGPAPNAVMD